MSTVHRDRGFANKDGDGKALVPPQIAELARIAEVHKGDQRCAAGDPFACSEIRAAGTNTDAAVWKGEAREVSHCHTALAQRWCSWGGWLCAPTPLLIAPSLSLFSYPDLPCSFLLWPLPSSCPSQSSSPALLGTDGPKLPCAACQSAALTWAVGFLGAGSDPTLPGSNGPRCPLPLSYLYSKCTDLQEVLILLVGQGGGLSRSKDSLSHLDLPILQVHVR